RDGRLRAQVPERVPEPALPHGRARAGRAVARLRGHVAARARLGLGARARLPPARRALPPLDASARDGLKGASPRGPFAPRRWPAAGGPEPSRLASSLEPAVRA